MLLCFDRVDKIRSEIVSDLMIYVLTLTWSAVQKAKLTNKISENICVLEFSKLNSRTFEM